MSAWITRVMIGVETRLRASSVECSRSGATITMPATVAQQGWPVAELLTISVPKEISPVGRLARLELGVFFPELWEHQEALLSATYKRPARPVSTKLSVALCTSRSASEVEYEPTGPIGAMADIVSGEVVTSLRDGHLARLRRLDDIVESVDPPGGDGSLRRLLGKNINESVRWASVVLLMRRRAADARGLVDRFAHQADDEYYRVWIARKFNEDANKLLSAREAAGVVFDDGP